MHENRISHLAKKKIGHLANREIPQMADAVGGFLLYTELDVMTNECWLG